MSSGSPLAGFARSEAEVVEICSSDDDDGPPATYEPLPSCPICLNDILDPAEKAVTDCMHTFCRSCLAEWLRLKRFCPLCKRRIRSFLTNILDDATYTTVDVPPSPQPHHHSHHHNHTHVHVHIQHALLELQQFHSHLHRHSHHDSAHAGTGVSGDLGVSGSGSGGDRALMDAGAGVAVARRRQLLTRSEDAGELLRQLHRIADRLGELDAEGDDLYGMDRSRSRGRSHGRGHAAGLGRAGEAGDNTDSEEEEDHRTSSRSRSRSGRGDLGDGRQRRRPGDRTAAEGPRQLAQPQPRPYFFRLQQRLAATSAAVLGAGASPALAPALREGPLASALASGASRADAAAERGRVSRWDLGGPADPRVVGTRNHEGAGRAASSGLAAGLQGRAAGRVVGEATDSAVAFRRAVYERGVWAAGVRVGFGGGRRWSQARLAAGGRALAGPAAGSMGLAASGGGQSGGAASGLAAPAMTGAGNAAAGMAGRPAAAAAATGARRGAGVWREQLERWLTRELTAVLGASDLTLLRALVLGLVDVYGVERGDWAAEAVERGFGAEPPLVAGRGAREPGEPTVGRARRVEVGLAGGAEAGRDDAGGPVAALRPFLFDRAAHFWHELRSFVLSGLSIEAYDNSVQYGTPPGAAEALPTAGRHEQGQERQNQQQQQQLQDGGGGAITAAAASHACRERTTPPGAPAAGLASPPLLAVMGSAPLRRQRPLAGAPLALSAVIRPAVLSRGPVLAQGAAPTAALAAAHTTRQEPSRLPTTGLGVQETGTDVVDLATSDGVSPAVKPPKAAAGVAAAAPAGRKPAAQGPVVGAPQRRRRWDERPPGLLLGQAVSAAPHGAAMSGPTGAATAAGPKPGEAAGGGAVLREGPSVGLSPRRNDYVRASGGGADGDADDEDYGPERDVQDNRSNRLRGRRDRRSSKRAKRDRSRSRSRERHRGDEPKRARRGHSRSPRRRNSRSRSDSQRRGRDTRGHGRVRAGSLSRGRCSADYDGGPPGARGGAGRSCRALGGHHRDRGALEGSPLAATRGRQRSHGLGQSGAGGFPSGEGDRGRSLDGSGGDDRWQLEMPPELAA